MDFLVYLPTPYSMRMIGIDQSQRNENHTIRKVSAPGGEGRRGKEREEEVH